jgi:ubiquinone/menaquinone biosynthesis C-methylase UbiE
MVNHQKSAEKLHENVPPDWYYRSLKENLLQKFWHTTRFTQIGKMIEPVNGNILDIGCADGVFTNIILQKSNAHKVTGIDVLKKSVDWAKKHWDTNTKLSFEVGDAHCLKYPDNTFSAVFALEVLEHVFEPKKVLNEIKRVLKQGGYAIFLVPTENILFKIIWFFWTKWRGRIWHHTHVQSFDKDKLAKTVSSLGFTVKEDKYFLLGMLNAVKVVKK